MYGLISWFTKNSVAANLLMVTILFSGIFVVTQRSILEVFPEFESQTVSVSISFRGATPSEVEEGVVVRVEEAVFDLVGIERISSTANEGSASVLIEIEDGYDVRDMLDDIKNRVDSINTFPDEIERPVYSLSQRRREAISVVVSGDVNEHDLRQLGERVRDDIVAIPGITQADLTEVRSYEISLEIPFHDLQKHQLTFDMIKRAIKDSSLDLPAGSIKTTGGEISLRTRGQAYSKEDFEKIVILQNEDGRVLTLGQIATINDGFEEESLSARFNDRPCVVIDIYRVGQQNAIELAEKVREYVHTVDLPTGIEISYWRDRSVIIKNRLNTLLKSAVQGGLLVFILLALFLRFTVAIWVCVGIPVCFAGALFVLPVLGVTINIVSLFAFILVLGIVVDDAIVTGENIYTHLKKTGDTTLSAIRGAQEVSVPVIFGVLTTIAAFAPLIFMGGRRGQIFAQIPLVIIPVLFFSLIESKLILPAHLKHMKLRSKKKKNILLRLQSNVADGLEYCIASFYKPLLGVALNYRYITLAIFFASLILAYSIVVSGNLRFVFFPRVQTELARATLAMPKGTSFDITSKNMDRIAQAAQKLKEKYYDEGTGESLIMNILATSGSTGRGAPESHKGRVSFEIMAPEKREIDITSSQLVGEWRKMIGPISGAKELTFRAEIGRSSSPVEIQLSGQDFSEMKAISQEIKLHLATYSGLFDITDSFEEGKEEILLNIQPEARHLNISRFDLASQVRQAFFGLEVQRVQRAKDDVRVILRYPKEERNSVENLETMMVHNAEGAWIPFKHLATAKVEKGFSSIKRVDRRRTISITADIDKKKVNMARVNEKLTIFLNQLMVEHPGILHSFEGEAEEQRDSFASLIVGVGFVFFIIYSLLAIPFKSYLQPLIVMSVIPFGLVGAILGHLISGLNLSILSVFGMLALSGVVVNDSLVLVDYVNKRRGEGVPLMDAVRISGAARFRAILLTSLTTFAGLMPLIFEKSTQAQFLIPMAVSLGYGILFATVITLFLIPVNYLILEDIKALFRWVASFFQGKKGALPMGEQLG